MSTVKLLSTFVKRTDGAKIPVEIDIDSSDKKEHEDYLTLLTSINSLLDFDNLIVLAGSGTSLTFKGIAPSMGRLWDKCKEQNPTLFEAVLETVRYDKNQPNIDEEKKEPWNDIELLLSLCDQYIALFP
ncbi:SIR2 family protein, partial [Vibrio parahaemolyticus]